MYGLEYVYSWGYTRPVYSLDCEEHSSWDVVSFVDTLEGGCSFLLLTSSDSATSFFLYSTYDIKLVSCIYVELHTVYNMPYLWYI